MSEKDMIGKQYEFFLISGAKLNGTVKEVSKDYITLGEKTIDIENHRKVTGIKPTHYISIDKIEYIKILEEKI